MKYMMLALLFIEFYNGHLALLLRFYDTYITYILVQAVRGYTSANPHPYPDTSAHNGRLSARS